MPMQEVQAGQPLLLAENIRVVFKPKSKRPIVALDDLSLSVEAGSVTGLVGPDGAGKTTCLRLAAGLLVPQSGSMTVLGYDVVQEADGMRSRIGYMPQQFGLYEDLTVQENLDLYADLQDVPMVARKEQFARLLDMTDLGEFTQRRAGQLSGGMKQKLGLACCLVKVPELLILDEPTVGVDPVSRRDIWRIVYQLVEEEGVGVVVSTAYLDEAERCNEVIVMHHGVKLAEGTPQSFYSRVEGRVFSIAPKAPQTARTLHGEMLQRGDVVDASIQSGVVRVVLSKDSPVRPQALLSEDKAHQEISKLDLEPVPPRFEDVFVDMLHQDGAAIEKPAEEKSVEIVHGLEKQVIARKEPAIVVSNLLKQFGAFTAVQNISFSVCRGEIFGLLGANGAGKTTTFRMLCGLLKASGGEINVAGNDMRTAPSRARSRIGYMAQKFSLYQQFTVKQNLRFYGKAYGLHRSHLQQRLDWALREFDMEDRKNAVTQSLPAGFKQRLAMAAAMLHEPEILFLDEPTSGADPLARREFWARINKFSREGVTVIVTTHFLEEAEYCDHMLIMAQGQQLAAGTPAQIRELAVSKETPDPTIEDAFIKLAGE
ncbi:ABC-2 type transport system ATP-binding protein [Halodesulfovibrio marinisediminis DSM 17456]|uniref:ABC-2 type transport system ATP-binding protein n=1 Tax=Halodesulfovibrio marinisediminis DSM 17456 TaxID=1121457 RepID=A0A1N6JA41_9BACT|nr:ABC-2 type transport system ATP-binding protein [Halodesulfovibrio marinisediminis DSM 17456]